jgi:hypothetical protein
MLVQVNKIFSARKLSIVDTLIMGLILYVLFLAYCHHYHVFSQDNNLAKEFNLSTNNNKNINNFSKVSNLYTVQQQTLSLHPAVARNI